MNFEKLKSFIKIFLEHLNKSSYRFLYVLPFGFIFSLLITSFAFLLRYLIFHKDIGEIALTLLITNIGAIFIGIFLLKGQLKIIGWSILLGSLLTIICFGYLFYLLATHHW